MRREKKKKKPLGSGFFMFPPVVGVFSPTMNLLVGENTNQAQKLI
jgi:hypothetical protein